MADEKRKCLSLETKIEMIRLIDEGWMKKCEIAKKFYKIPANSL